MDLEVAEACLELLMKIAIRNRDRIQARNHQLLCSSVFKSVSTITQAVASAFCSQLQSNIVL